MFNAKPKDVGRICRTAQEVKLDLVNHKEIGGMMASIAINSANVIQACEIAIEKII